LRLGAAGSDRRSDWPLHALVVIGEMINGGPDLGEFQSFFGRWAEQRERFHHLDAINIEPGAESVMFKDRWHAVMHETD
jgi:hypothetical protein